MTITKRSTQSSTQKYGRLLKEEKWVRIIQESYKGAEDKKGRWFEVQRGVKQGDPLSPNIFNAMLEEVFRKLERENKGIQINGIWMNHLRFADDIVPINDDLKQLEVMANELGAESRKVGLKINLGKTKLLSNQREI